MAYDYNALVSKIASHRRRKEDGSYADMQQAVDTFSDLSSKCPMTPLLWMQYASDAGKLFQTLLDNSQEATEMRLQTLELGLSEFPGCALLHLYYLRELSECSATETAKQDQEKVRNAFEDALSNVGQGSHQSEGELVANIYRLYTDYLVRHNLSADSIKVFLRRAQIPMKDANDALVDEFQQFCKLHNIPTHANDLAKIENGRKFVSKYFGSLVALEGECDAAMHEEEILTRHQVNYNNIDWDALLQSESSSLWMGLGGAKSSASFANYAQRCARYSPPPITQDDHDDKEGSRQKDGKEQIQALALSVYERGAAECPTVESFWLSYIRYVFHLKSLNDPSVTTSKLQNVCARAARNCPYSLTIYQQKMKCVSVSAEAGEVILEPDAIMDIVQEAINAKFLSSQLAYLELYLSAIRIVKRRIMSIVSKATTTGRPAAAAGDSQKILAFDVAESMGKVRNNSNISAVYVDLDADTEQEVQDLVEDLQDMYETADAYLRQNYKSWSEGRSLLWNDRALTETHLLVPMMNSLKDSDSNDEIDKMTGDEMTGYFEKLVRMHSPTHPDNFLEYIRCVIGGLRVSVPGEIVARLRKVRGLYEKALQSVRKYQQENTVSETNPFIGSSLCYRNPETALHALCHEYMKFEQTFGSEQSFANASKIVQKKLEKPVSNDAQTLQKVILQTPLQVTAPQVSVAIDPQPKRKLSDGQIEQPDGKKQKITAEQGSMPEIKAKESLKKANLKIGKQYPEHKVRLGDLEYPAHPFTVCVSNLALETEDMELVELFKLKCGPVIHARILREKHSTGKGKSKGHGLIQFEERESVDKALAFHEELGLHEKLVKVARSHMPAVTLVPPGMHHVNAQGHGRSSNRNQKRKDVKEDGKNTKNKSFTNDGQFKKPHVGDNANKSKTSVLAFLPRGVAPAPGRRKIKLSK